MATFFTSDIHGEYELFCRLLDEISFCSGDTLFVLGDVIDKGKNSIKLAKLIYSLPNIKMICGNHEYSFINYYQSLMREIKDGDDFDAVLANLKAYFPDEQEGIEWELIDYLEALPRYIETDEFICVHAGVQLDNNKRIVPLKNQEPNIFLFERRFADSYVIPLDSKAVLFGHTPCFYKNGSGKIIKTPKIDCDINSQNIKDFAKIQLDSGVSFTKMLGALRLEDMREFYVKEI